MQWNTFNAKWIKRGILKHLAYICVCDKRNGTECKMKRNDEQQENDTDYHDH